MKATVSPKKETNPTQITLEDCRAQEMLRLTAGKWKPQILLLATRGNLRFNTLVKQLPGSNKQSVSQALKDLEAVGILSKKTIRLKPLHIEYSLTEKGRAMIPILKSMEQF